MIGFHSNRLSLIRRVRFDGMQNRQFLIGIALLLTDRWADANAFVAQLQFGDIGRVIAQLYAMQPLNRDLGHLVGDRVASIAREPIDCGATIRMRM